MQQVDMLLLGSFLADRWMICWFLPMVFVEPLSQRGDRRVQSKNRILAQSSFAPGWDDAKIQTYVFSFLVPGLRSFYLFTLENDIHRHSSTFIGSTATNNWMKNIFLARQSAGRPPLFSSPFFLTFLFVSNWKIYRRRTWQIADCTNHINKVRLIAHSSDCCHCKIAQAKRMRCRRKRMWCCRPSDPSTKITAAYNSNIQQQHTTAACREHLSDTNRLIVECWQRT